MRDRSRINNQRIRIYVIMQIYYIWPCVIGKEKLEINREKAIHHLLNNTDFHTPLSSPPKNMEINSFARAP